MSRYQLSQQDSGWLSTAGVIIVQRVPVVKMGLDVQMGQRLLVLRCCPWGLISSLAMLPALLAHFYNMYVSTDQTIS